MHKCQWLKYFDKKSQNLLANKIAFDWNLKLVRASNLNSNFSVDDNLSKIILANTKSKIYREKR